MGIKKKKEKNIIFIYSAVLLPAEFNDGHNL